eukprot:3570347-Rhodomonas_salina.1
MLYHSNAVRAAHFSSQTCTTTTSSRKPDGSPLAGVGTGWLVVVVVVVVLVGVHAEGHGGSGRQQSWRSFAARRRPKKSRWSASGPGPRSVSQLEPRGS